MATTKNITMKQFNGTDYDTLYPKTVVNQVDNALNKTGDTMTGQLNVPAFALTNYNAALEIGKNIDFRTAGSTNDYDARLTYDSGKLLFGLFGGDYKTILHSGNLFDYGAFRIASGSYVGTGVYGENNPNSLTFDFVPKAVFIIGCDTSSGVKTTYFGSSGVSTLESIWAMYYDRLTTSYAANVGFGTRFNNYSPYGKRSSDGKTFYWYATYIDAEYQFNVSGTTYYYLVFA